MWVCIEKNFRGCNVNLACKNVRYFWLLKFQASLRCPPMCVTVRQYPQLDSQTKTSGNWLKCLLWTFFLKNPQGLISLLASCSTNKNGTSYFWPVELKMGSALLSTKYSSVLRSHDGVWRPAGSERWLCYDRVYTHTSRKQPLPFRSP